MFQRKSVQEACIQFHIQVHVYICIQVYLKFPHNFHYSFNLIPYSVYGGRPNSSG